MTTIQQLGLRHAWSDVTLRTAMLAAAFCSSVSAIYALAEVEASPAVLFLWAAPTLAVILWLQKDARRLGGGELQDWGFFLWLAWPVLLPWHVLRTRGGAGVPLVLGLFGLILSPMILGFGAPWMLYVVRYAIWYLNYGS